MSGVIGKMFWKRKKNNIGLIKSIQKLEVEDGNIIVLNCPGSLSSACHENLKSTIREVLSDNGLKVKVVLLEGGVVVSRVLRKQQPEQKQTQQKPSGKPKRFPDTPKAHKALSDAVKDIINLGNALNNGEITDDRKFTAIWDTCHKWWYELEEYRIP
jgi:hypothetical protein